MVEGHDWEQSKMPLDPNRLKDISVYTPTRLQLMDERICLEFVYFIGESSVNILTVVARHKLIS